MPACRVGKKSTSRPFTLRSADAKGWHTRPRTRHNIGVSDTAAQHAFSRPRVRTTISHEQRLAPAVTPGSSSTPPLLSYYKPIPQTKDALDRRLSYSSHTSGAKRV